MKYLDLLKKYTVIFKTAITTKVTTCYFKNKMKYYSIFFKIHRKQIHNKCLLDTVNFWDINGKRQVLFDHKEIIIFWNMRYENQHLLLYMR